MKATILKTMTANGKTLKFGDIVDVSDWKHTKNLESNRYIKVLAEEPVAEEKPKLVKKAQATK